MKALLNKLLKNIKPILLILVVGYFLYLMADILFFTHDSKKDEKTDITFKDAFLTGFAPSGAKIWDFKTESIEYINSNTANAKKINGVLYKDNNPFIQISASKAQIDTMYNNFTATGGIKFRVIGKEQEFQSDKVDWVAWEKKLTATGHTVVRVDENHLTGGVLTYYLEKESFQMDENIRLEVDVEVK